jgi:hypothetical protein
VAAAELIVVGASLLGFSLAAEVMHKGVAQNAGNGPAPPDVSHPAMRSWLADLKQGTACVATLETRIW